MGDIRGQIIFRDQGAAEYGMRLVCGTGIIESHDDEFAEHVIRGFSLVRDTDGLLLRFTDFAFGIEDIARGARLSHPMTMNVWPRTSPALGLESGGMFFRKTRMPAPENKAVYLFAMVACARSGTLPGETMFSLSGSCSTPMQMAYDDRLRPCSVTWRIANPVSCPEAAAPGSSIETALLAPLWGFGPEPLAFHSTMDIASIDEMQELISLYAKDALTPEEEARVQHLKYTPGGSAAQSSAQDPEYAAFQRELRKEMGPFDYSGVSTASELEALHRMSSSIVARLLAA